MVKDIERSYHRLIIRASPRADIWLADDDGHLVQKERGILAKPGGVTVPGKPGDELPPGTLYSILRQAGLKS